MIELAQILTGLVERTSEGKLKWSRTVQDHRFATSIGAISVVISEFDGQNPPRYGLDILDESGETVESLRYHNSTAEQDQQMERLFFQARRSALNIDEILERLAKGLEL